MEKSVDVDEIIRKLKTWGIYNSLQLTYIFICFIPVAFPVLIILFIGYQSEHQCKPLSRPLNEYDLGITGNGSDYVMDIGQCDITIRSGNSSNITYTPRTIKCVEGHEYDTGKDLTFVNEWDLVCENLGLGELTQTLIMLGQALGASFFTTLSDRYGRKTVYTGTFIISSVLAASASFAPSYLVFIIILIATGTIQQGLSLSLYALAIEMFPLETRGTIAAAAGMFWAVACVILTAFSYILRFQPWRTYQLATVIFSFHSLFGYWLMDESLRWLIANNKRTRVIALIKKIARRNKVDPTEALSLFDGSTHDDNIPLNKYNGVVEDIQSIDEKGNEMDDNNYTTPMLANGKEVQQIEIEGPVVERLTVFDIFRHRVLLRNSLIIWYTWGINSLTYYGLLLNSHSLSGDRFLNFLINGVLEIPSGLAVWYMINKFGRKKTSIFFHTVAGLALIISVALLVPKDDNGVYKIASISLNFFGKFAVTGSWTTMALYTPELYPTNLRNAGIGVASAAARIGGMVAPYSNVLARFVFWAPGVIFGVGCLLVNFGILFLPETMGRELPQNMEELLAFCGGKS